MSDKARCWNESPGMNGMPYRAIIRERIRAHEKYDASDCSVECMSPDDESWLGILAQEFAEIPREMFRPDRKDLPDHWERLRTELVQLAAMASAWIDSIDELLEKCREA